MANESGGAGGFRRGERRVLGINMTLEWGGKGEGVCIGETPREAEATLEIDHVGPAGACCLSGVFIRRY